MFPFMAQSFRFLICRSLKYTWARRARRARTVREHVGHVGVLRSLRAHAPYVLYGRARGRVGHAIKQTPTTPAF